MDTIFGILTSVLVETITPGTAGLAIAVIGLNIHFGYTGLLNFGQAGFMLLGAYGFAISIIQGLPLPLAVLVGFGAAFLFALVLGIPTLKLRGDYLAIVTISAAEIIRYTGRLSLLDEFTGAAKGLRGSTYRGPFVELSPFDQDPAATTTLLEFNYQDVADGAIWVRLLGLAVFIAAIVTMVVVYRAGRMASATSDGKASRLHLGRFALLVALGILAFVAVFFAIPLEYPQTGSNGWWVRLVAWTFVFISAGIMFLLARSPWGRLLRGIREDEDAIRSLGRNVFAIKMQALVIGGLFGALGGMLFVLPTTVQPDALGRQVTFLAYTALLLGGAATVFGPILGSVLFFSTRILIRETASEYVPSSIMNTQQTDQFSFIVVGVALMLLVIFRPQGILGDKREVQINV